MCCRINRSEAAGDSSQKQRNNASWSATVASRVRFVRRSNCCCPGMTVFREDNAVVVRIPVNFRRRNGRQMVLTCGGEERPAKPDRLII